MSGYLLSSQAAGDLTDIFDYGLENWGERQASAYVHELFEVFGHISRHPQIGRLRPDLGEGLRSFPHGSHIIFFMPWQGETAIVRVLHGARDHEDLFVRAEKP